MSDTINVSLNAAVQINIGNDRMKCNNDTVHLSAPSGYSNYKWAPPYNIITNTGQSVIVNPLIDTSYYFTAETSPGCYVFDTIKITVKNSNNINLGINTSFCMGDSLSLNAGPGFTQFVWNTGQISQQIWAHTTGFYSVKATAMNGCTSKDTLQIVNVFSKPVVILDDSPNLCRGEKRKFDAGAGFKSYMWNTNDTTQIIYSSTIGFYKVVITDVNGCNSFDSVSIMTISDPPSNFLRDTLSKCDYENIQVNSLNNYKSYLWSTGSQNKQIMIEKLGKYFLTVIDDKNCKGIDSINIFYKDCLKGFYIPSAFTPDHDGKNDVFKPFISGSIKNYKFQIYNRYGQLVFVSTDKNIGWNGNITGTTLNNNTFVWFCSYTSDSGMHLEERGTVLLVR